MPLSGNSGVIDRPSGLQDVIIWTQPSDTDAAIIGREVTSTHVGHLGHVYRTIPGFSASLPLNAIDALRDDSRIKAIVADDPAFLQAQTLPTGVDRIDADQNPVASIDGFPGNENAGLPFPFYVATIDTGIDLTHPDLNVVGGRNFLRGNDDANFGDGNGHGTHVAGTMAAIDNSDAVVGVAPGAGVYAVKAFDNSGRGKTSDILAAMDHIVQQREVFGAPIAVLNMSFVGASGAAPFLEAMANLGIVMFGAAGNAGGSGSSYPARDIHVTSVAALADSNGQAGAPGADTSAGPDETIADFSNCCTNVDLAAPGVDILSTWPKGNGQSELSGTSMASPHAAGAAALFIAEHADSWATPGITSDLLDTVLVREALTETAKASGQFVTRQDDSTRGTYVLQAEGNWITPPVVSVASDHGSVLLGSITTRVDARDVDTDWGSLVFDITLVDSGGSAIDVTPTATYVPADANFPYGSYDLNWVTAGLTDGIYELSVTATDMDGTASNPDARLTRNRITVQIDDGLNDPPSVAVTSPLAGDLLSGSVALWAEVTDDGQVDTVTFTITDSTGAEVSTAIASEHTPATPTEPAVWLAIWDSTAVPDGSYSISATAVDVEGAAGQTASATPVEVSNVVAGGTVKVADLDGTARIDSKRFWRGIARVRITALDGNPVEGVTVYGYWHTAANGYLTTWSPTDADGWIEHHVIRLLDIDDPITYTITRVEHPDYVYEPLLNSDPDGDSVISEAGEMVITITKSMATAELGDATKSDAATQAQVVAAALQAVAAEPLAIQRGGLEDEQSSGQLANLAEPEKADEARVLPRVIDAPPISDRSFAANLAPTNYQKEPADVVFETNDWGELLDEFEEIDPSGWLYAMSVRTA